VVILLPEINKQYNSTFQGKALLTLGEGPSLETSSFCLFISGSINITTQHSNFNFDKPFGNMYMGLVPFTFDRITVIATKKNTEVDKL
jgi:hypothetical protein